MGGVEPDGWAKAGEKKPAAAHSAAATTNRLTI